MKPAVVTLIQICLAVAFAESFLSRRNAEDWVDTYRRYVLGTVALAVSAPTFRRRVTERLKTDARPCPYPELSDKSEDPAASTKPANVDKSRSWRRLSYLLQYCQLRLPAQRIPPKP